MSKKEQLMEYLVQDIVLKLMDDRGIDVEAAMNIFYNSVVCDKLHNGDTGLYLEGTLYVYDLLLNEIENGALIQEEI